MIEKKQKSDAEQSSQSTAISDDEYNKILNEKNKKFKWLLLFIAVFASTSGQISFVFPAYFEIQLKELLEIGDLEYNLLFSIQCLPNIVLPMFTGLMPQKFGLGKSIFMIMIIVFAGHFSQFVSVYFRSYYMLMMARLLVGIGFVNYATLLVVQITNWFYGSQLGLASSIQMLSGKLGLAFSGFFFSFWQSSDPSGAYVLYQPLFFLLIFGGLCLLMCLLSIHWDYTEEERERKRKIQIQQEKEQQQEKEKISFVQFVQNVWGQITALNKLYWIVLVLGSMVNGIYYSFLNNVQVILADEYNITGPIASIAYTLPMLISAIVSPISGIICDKNGNFRDLWFYGSFFVFSPFLYILSGVRFESEEITALTPAVLLGCFYGFVNVIRQPCIRYAVKEEQYSFATGLSISYINMIMILFPIIFGTLLDQGISVVVFFGFIYSIVFMLGTLFMIFYDKRTNNMLVDNKKKDNQQEKAKGQNNQNINNNNNQKNSFQSEQSMEKAKINGQYRIFSSSGDQNQEETLSNYSQI